MIFDSHCHPQFPQYDKDREEMIKQTLEAGVNMICVGTDLETSRQGIELAEEHDNIWATVGIHPNDINMGTMLADMVPMLVGPKIVALGEVGLDYYRTPEPEKQKKQKEALEQFIDLAQKIKKPLIIHCRDAAKGTTGKAHQDMIDIISTLYSRYDRDVNTTPRLGVMHSFTGTINQAKKYLELGFYLGFNGIITFTRQYDDVVKYTPLEQILLETDAPYLTPMPYRGQRNEPTYVIEVAKKVAELKNKPLEKVIEMTTKNCKKLFGI